MHGEQKTKQKEKHDDLVYCLACVIVCWYLIGMLGFIFWWTYEWGLETKDFLFSLKMGLLGPIAWVVGWRIHGKKEK